MARQNSVAVRNGWLNSTIGTVGATPRLRLYTGAQPASCAVAATGTQLLDTALPATWLAAAAAGIVSGANLPWVGTAAGFAGSQNAGYYRIYESTGVTCHEQGSVSYSSIAWAQSTAFTVGQRVNPTTGNVYQCATAGTSAGTGTGPVGTGAGIVDGAGTLTWNYVSAVGDMTLDNIVLAATQNVSVNSYQTTAGNA
jgi:hypothetical protein